MLRLNRHGAKLAARSAGWAGFYPCAGALAGDQAALAQALYDVAGQQALRSLRRDPHARDEHWLHGKGWCLSKQELH